MKTLNQATKLLFYKVFNNSAASADYLNWAYALLEAGIESDSLKRLTSMNRSESIFLFDDYVNRTLRELDIGKPEFEECARSYLAELCAEIINNSRNTFDVVRDIVKLIVELGLPLDLSNWIELDDGIDRIIYDDEHFKPDEKMLRARIEAEARSYLASLEVED